MRYDMLFQDGHEHEIKQEKEKIEEKENTDFHKNALKIAIIDVKKNNKN